MTLPENRLFVVFVCTGNICRSPIAEQVFIAELQRAGLADDVDVTSAGLDAWHVGEPADPRTARLLRAAGYPDKHVARRIDAQQLRADLVVALDNGHRRALERMVADPGRVRLLRSFDPGSPPHAEVADPYFGERESFAAVLTQVRAAMPGMIEWVRAHR